MLIGSLWVGLAVQGARASEPVVHDGGADVDLARVSEAARVPLDQLRSTTVAELRQRPAALVGSGELLACEGSAVTREQLLLALQGTEGALTYDDPERARNELSRVADTASCPPPFDAELLARFWVMRGLLDAGERERDFGFARSLSPSLTWGEGWPQEAAGAFEAAAVLPPVVVRVPHDGVTIDGVVVDARVSLVPGWHTVRTQGFEGGLIVDADALLIVPAATPVDLLGGVDTEAGRELPTALLAEAFGAGNRVFVASPAGIWAATAGRTDWLPLQSRRKHPLVGIGLGTSAVGAAGTAVTGVLAALAYGAATSAGDAVGAATTPTALVSAEQDFSAKADRYGTMRWLPIPFAAVTVAGLSMTGAGIALGPVTVNGGR